MAGPSGPSKPPPKNSPHSSDTGTPNTLRGNTSWSDSPITLDSEPVPVINASDARKWLDKKGWTLPGEHLDCPKLVNILRTISRTPDLPPPLSSALLSVAFLLNDLFTDNLSTHIASSVAVKVLASLANTSSSLASSAKSLEATSTQQVSISLALKETSSQAASSSASLADLATNLTAAKLAPPPTPPSWSSIVSSNLPPPSTLPSSEFNPNATSRQTLLQQRILSAARLVVVELDSNDLDAPKDKSHEAMNTLDSSFWGPQGPFSGLR